MNQIIRHQLGVITELDEVIGELRRAHIAQNSGWMPAEILPKDHVPGYLPPELTAMLVLNLLTEDGLPYFLSLIVHHLGDKGEMWKWSRRWTAEENRHGTVLKHYMRCLLSEQQMAHVERAETEYLESGFWPDWEGHPYQLLGYVIMQEMATQLSHANIARLARHHDPVLGKILGKIAGEEGAHHRFYLSLFQHIIACDSTGSIRSLWQALRSFAMPGNSIPDFNNLAYLEERLNVFGPNELAVVVERVIERLNLEQLSQLAPEDYRARESICTMPKMLRRIAERNQRKDMRIIPLTFLGEHVSVTV